jgi:Spy/CpxP family protein refolding chaperone
MTHPILSQILSLLAFIVPPAAADDEPGARGHRGKGTSGLCERLECSDEQRVELEAIRAEHHRERADERAEAKRLREALKAERREADPDPADLSRLRAELDAHELERREAKARLDAEIAAVLTPAQRERLRMLKAERKAERGEKGKAKRADRGHGKNGKVHAKRKAERGENGKAHAKRKAERGKNGKAHAKRYSRPRSSTSTMS